MVVCHGRSGRTKLEREASRIIQHNIWQSLDLSLELILKSATTVGVSVFGNTAASPDILGIFCEATTTGWWFWVFVIAAKRRSGRWNSISTSYRPIAMMKRGKS